MPGQPALEDERHPPDREAPGDEDGDEDAREVVAQEHPGEDRADDPAGLEGTGGQRVVHTCDRPSLPS